MRAAVIDGSTHYTSFPLCYLRERLGWRACMLGILPSLIWVSICDIHNIILTNTMRTILYALEKREIVGMLEEEGILCAKQRVMNYLLCVPSTFFSTTW